MGLYQKIRPPKYKDMVGQETVTKNLLAQSKADTWFQVLIFGGMYGCGKTTAARITAMAVNCTNKDADGDPCGECVACKAVLSGNCVDIIEVDGASNTGVENVRELQEQASFLPMVLKKKVFILDEVHMLSNAAFNSLLKTLEEPPAHCMFILCTTDVEKIPQTIRSRSACYTFGRIAENVVAEYLTKTAAKEKIDITEEACNLLAKRSDGSMRNALMLLEMVSGTGKQINGESVSEILGISTDASVVELLKSVAECNVSLLIEKTGEFAKNGKNFYTLTGEMLSTATDLIQLMCCGKLVASDAYISALRNVNIPLEKACELSKGVEEMKADLRIDASENAFIVSALKCMDRFMVKAAAKEIVVPVTQKPMVEAPTPKAIEKPAETATEKKAEEPKVEEAKTDEAKSSTIFDSMFDAFANLFGGSADTSNDNSEFVAVDESNNPFADTESTEEESQPETAEDSSAVEDSAADDESAAELEEYYKIKDEEDKDFPFPSFLKSSDGLSPKAKVAFYALREVCKQERSINSNFVNSFSLEARKDGLTLIGNDMMAMQSVMIVIARYEVPYMEIKFK